MAQQWTPNYLIIYNETECWCIVLPGICIFVTIFVNNEPMIEWLFKGCTGFNKDI